MRGPVYWPPFSPDLTPCDFYLWGVVKEYVSKENPQSAEEAQRLIEQAFQGIRRAQTGREPGINERPLTNTQRSIVERIKICVERNGGHIENVIKCMRCNVFK